VAIDVPMTVMRARQESQQVVLWGAIRLLLAIVLNLVFVVWLRMGVLGVLLSTIISGGAVGGYLVSRLLRITGLHFQPAMARALVAFGAPFAIWELGSFVLHFSDRFFLNAYSTLETVGLYSLSYKVAIVIPFFVTGPFSSIWLPKALEIEKREGSGRSRSSPRSSGTTTSCSSASRSACRSSRGTRSASPPARHSMGRTLPSRCSPSRWSSSGTGRSAQIGVIIK
jgi:O-antigen/teichoic acid export membrane protein